VDVANHRLLGEAETPTLHLALVFWRALRDDLNCTSPQEFMTTAIMH